LPLAAAAPCAKWPVAPQAHRHRDTVPVADPSDQRF
jgi:hypothetical protein